MNKIKISFLSFLIFSPNFLSIFSLTSERTHFTSGECTQRVQYPATVTIKRLAVMFVFF